MILIVYDVARSIHIERLKQYGDNLRLIYRKKSYDFETEQANKNISVQQSFVGTISSILKETYDVIELNEPLWIGNWPRLIPYLMAIKVKKIFGGGKISVVCYAIENNNVTFAVQRKITFLPQKIVKILFEFVARLIIGQFDKIAFGTDAAREEYDLLSNISVRRRKHIRVFDALDQACTECHFEKRSKSVIFLGAFERRKGILNLLEAWPKVAFANPDATLTIIGKGELENEIRTWSVTAHNVKLFVDPQRSEIHRALAPSKVLVLLSQKLTNWREQIGLPILEGLSHGCEIVSSDQTGIASWLKAHGHRVISWEAPPEVLAKAISEAIGDPRDYHQIQRALPEKDQRLEAASWIWGN